MKKVIILFFIIREVDMKKVIILFFIISNSFLLYGQSTTIPLVIEKSYQLKNIPSPQDIAWDGNTFWVLDNFTFRMYKLGSDYENIDTSIYFTPRDFRDFTFDGKYFWIVDNTLHQVFKLNIKDHEMDQLSLPVEKFISGITCSNTEIYISWEDGYSSQIAKVVPGTDSVSTFNLFTMGSYVTGLTYHDSSFFYCSIDKNPSIFAAKPNVYQLKVYTLPNEIKTPTDVEIISGCFWVLDFETRKLYKLKEDSTSSGVTEPIVPNMETLNQNYPNPFNPQTTIEYSIKNSDYVTLKVYDILGKEIAVLIDEFKNAGNYKVEFNTYQLGLTSGVYFYTLKTGDYSTVKKMILIK
jgi:hypothetical protein